MKQSNKFALAAIAIAVAAGLAACGKKEEPKAEAKAAPAPAAPQEVVIKIGHVGPTSGQIAHLGKDNENGAKLAVEEANAKGIMVDGKKAKFELLTEDDAADGKQATQVAQKLMDAKVVGVVGHLNSGTSIPASAIYNQAGVAQISPSATNPKLTNQGFKGVFRMVANDVAQGTAIGNYAAAKLGKKIAIIDDKTAYGVGLADETEKAVKAAGGAVVIREALANEKEQDFKGVLTKVKAKNPDVIMFGGMDAQAGPMLKQMKALGIKAKFISGDGAQSAELIKLGGDAAEGSYATTAGLPKEKMPQGAAFYDKFKAKFNADVQVYAPFTYDATNVLIAAIQKAGTDPAKIIDAIKATSMDGVTGKIAFDDKGDIKDGAVTVFQVKGGKWETVEIVGGPKEAAPAAAAPAAAAPAAAPAPAAAAPAKEEKKK
ncbi:MAG TPA: branched-chain amino acid ABC transporter substrate-binding protein [Casimicrobium huifangae]|jgi:branched-chain amino acid transport system substrate-binding protein|nr:branched-chain amino acid ABC transporter substrate-binding protein [Casimicrobium huifangae]HQA33274.1 branched-chain amino acid ABC transporter substrate-binding protein [Casimicrobium huifangae]HQD63680.1 branched-chain amino acid ABC transporter substrate-binding protein [Casimicrobium huifangae]